MPINILATAGISFDAAGLYRQTLSSPDGVFIFNDGLINWEIINKKGPYVARLGGIIPSAGDVTSALQIILNSSDVTEVVFDEGDITINGTLTVPAGKILTFQNDGKLIGSGTINGGIINADFNKQIFATTLTLNPQSVSNIYFSVKWYGAKGDDSTADEVPIQKSVDMIVRNYTKFHNLYFPNGKYKITKPIIAYNWDGSNYQFHTVNFIGETTFWEASNAGSAIRATFSDSFALGIQLGKGCSIRNLKFEGAYVAPSLTYAAFYDSTWNSYGNGGARDSAFSPYSGIVIDPFTNRPVLPSDGGYPGTDAFGVSLSSYYRGTSGDEKRGSTGITIDECFIQNFLIGIITSPNGVTLNAELIDIIRVQFSNVKGCIAGCQAQEKLNRASFLGCWGETHTILVFNKYGASSQPITSEVGHWVIENVNVAGRNNTFCSRSETGYFPMKISNVYAESLGKIGEIKFTMGSTISDSVFDLEYPRAGTVNDSAKSYYISAEGVCTFRNCLFRYYDGTGSLPMIFNGRFAFDSCRFTTPPINLDNYEVAETGYLGTTVMTNCYTKAGFINTGVTTPQSVLPSFGFNYYADGTNVIKQAGELSSGVVIKHEPESSLNQSHYIYVLNGGATASLTITGTDRQVTIPASLENLGWLTTSPTSVVVFYTPGGQIVGAGRVTSISATDFTVSYLTNTMTNGNYRVGAYRAIQFLSFLGDVTSGSNLITNVRVDIGDAASFVGKDNVFIQNVENYSGSGGIQAFSIDSWNNTTKTFTCSKTFNNTLTGVYFNNNGYVKNISSLLSNVNIFTNVYTGQYLLQKGGKLTVSEGGSPVTYLVTKSGFMNAASQSDSRQAEWVLDNCCPSTTTTTTTTTP